MSSDPMPVLRCSFLLLISALLLCQLPAVRSADRVSDSPTYLWPLPAQFSYGEDTLSVDPTLLLVASGNGGSSSIVREAFDRYKAIIFKNGDVFSIFNAFRKRRATYDIAKLNVVVHSASEELQLGVDESYNLTVGRSESNSIYAEATIVANTVYGALRGLETFSQLCTFDYGTKSVLIFKSPWHIHDKPRFKYRGLLLDTSRHYLPVGVIKHILESMSFAKLNVLHWHIIDEQSFPLEVPAYPKLWQGAYSKWERYTVEDAYEIVDFAKSRGINVMAEVDVPGHAESWGKGYPGLWPSSSCREPLDVSKNFTFDVITGILANMRKIFPFELFHLGGDEVNTDCWTSTPHVKQWLKAQNMTAKEAYQYFVLKAQEIAISKNWSPVNWEETFNTFAGSLNPRTCSTQLVVIFNYSLLISRLGQGVCPKVVAKGFRCIFSNQGVWYLDHLEVPWHQVYTAEPLEGISDPAKQELVLGGEVCMWGGDSRFIKRTTDYVAPGCCCCRRRWSRRDTASSNKVNYTAFPRLYYFRCLLTGRGVQAAPVTNKIGRSQANGPVIRPMSS